MPDPGPIRVGILADVIELEVGEAAAPLLEEDSGFGEGIALLIRHADSDGAAGLHREVDRPHLGVDAQLLHVRGPALRRDHEPGRLRFAADQPVGPVVTRLRLADVVEELGTHQGADDRLPLLRQVTLPVTVSPRSRTIFPDGSRPRSMRNSPRVKDRLIGLKPG